MQPTRAAWFFAAGIAWLALRGILVHAMPSLRIDQIAQHGGLLLILPLISVVASLTAPLFFFSFLRRHRFTKRRVLQGATISAATAALLSSLLVLVSFIAMAVPGDSACLCRVHLYFSGCFCPAERLRCGSTKIGGDRGHRNTGSHGHDCGMDSPFAFRRRVPLVPAIQPELSRQNPRPRRCRDPSVVPGDLRRQLRRRSDCDRPRLTYSV